MKKHTVYNELPIILTPIKLKPELESLCKKIDEYYSSTRTVPFTPSDLIRGAYFAIREECVSNPEKISHAANSLREIIYPFWNKSAKSLLDVYRQYAINHDHKDRIFDKQYLFVFSSLDSLYKNLNDLAHHGLNPSSNLTTKQCLEFSTSNFEKLLGDFVSLLHKAIAYQEVYTHTVIDVITSKRRPRNVKEISIIINSGYDAKQYFFYKATIKFLDLLFKNGLLDDIKKKAEDPNRYSYKTPELHYLLRMSAKDKNPGKVSEIINSVKISKATFNPEVVDQFLRICGDLPAVHLAKIVPKIQRENWVALMGAYNHLDFEFKDMFITLLEAKDFKSALILAEVVLSVKSKADITKEGRAGFENPFYFSHITDTAVFENLLGVSGDCVENAFDITLKAFSNIVNLGSKSKDKTSFEIEDVFNLFDLDFFTATSGRKHSTFRESVTELAVVVKALASRLIELNKNDKNKLLEIYDKSIHPLPDSQLVWRLRLYILSLAPKVYSKIIEEALSRIFKAKNYYDIIAGAEYYKLLKASFSSLSKDFQNKYPVNVIRYFSELVKKNDDEREKWDKISCSRILSAIAGGISKSVKEEAEKAGFIINADFMPKPVISPIEGGIVHEESPVTQEELDELSIEQIVEKLTSEWSSETLDEKYKTDNFISPRNAEGLGNAIKENIQKRLPEYIKDALLFIDENKLNSHYTYSYLNGIKEAVKANPISAAKINWSPLFALLNNIISANKNGLADNKAGFSPNRTWLADWIAVHVAMVDVIKEIISDNNDKVIIDFSRYRDEILVVFRYLLSYPDPVFADEQIKTAKITTMSPDEDAYVSDPYTIAINSVRGRAFEAFVLFVYQDGKRFTKKAKIKISDDCKELYKSVLDKENTTGIMFLFGHNIPSFYYRDKSWHKSLLPEIFPTIKNKLLLYTASWEGYLSNNLYQEIFLDSEFQKIYERGIELEENKSLKLKHFVELDEGLATHLALAFTHYKEFNLDSPLFKKFLEEGSDKQLTKFISFIGRSVVSGDNEKLDKFVQKNTDIKEKLVIFWDWALNNKEGVDIFKEFGPWISTEKGIFDCKWLIDHVKRTLEKSQGELDWELGLLNSIVKFAEISPENTLEITKLFLLDSWEKRRQSNVFYHMDKEWLDTFTILYNNPKTKIGTYKLINDLILKGGSVFWKLEDVVK